MRFAKQSLALFVLFGATGAPEAAAQVNAPSAGIDCLDPASLSTQIRKLPSSEEAAGLDLKWDPAFTTWHEILGVYELGSPCAARVAGFTQFLVQMDNDQSYALLHNNVLVTGQERVFTGIAPPRPTYHSAYFNPADVTGVPPPVPGAQYVTAIELGGPVREGYQSVLGLWQTPTGSLLAAFLWKKGETPAMPRIIATSSTRITALGFFPSPDSPSGNFSIVQRPDASRAVLTMIGIFHLKWFQP